MLSTKGRHGDVMATSFDEAWAVSKFGGQKYRIVRNYFSDNKKNRTIKSRLTLDEAQAHCRDPATSNTGEGIDPEDQWFDGYEEM